MFPSVNRSSVNQRVPTYHCHIALWRDAPKRRKQTLPIVENLLRLENACTSPDAGPELLVKYEVDYYRVELSECPSFGARLLEERETLDCMKNGKMRKLLLSRCAVLASAQVSAIWVPKCATSTIFGSPSTEIYAW